MMYKAVVQALLLYGSEIWVMTDAILMVIEEFRHSISRLIEGMSKRKGDGGEWEWSYVDVAWDTTVI